METALEHAGAHAPSTPPRHDHAHRNALRDAAPGDGFGWVLFMPASLTALILLNVWLSALMSR